MYDNLDYFILKNGMMYIIPVWHVVPNSDVGKSVFSNFERCTIFWCIQVCVPYLSTKRVRFLGLQGGQGLWGGRGPRGRRGLQLQVSNMGYCKNITMVWDAADFQTSVLGTVYNRHWVRNLVAAWFSIISFLFWATITLTVILSCYRYIAWMRGCWSFRLV